MSTPTIAVSAATGQLGRRLIGRPTTPVGVTLRQAIGTAA